MKVIRSPLFTDEELSAILDAHESAVLSAYVPESEGSACLLMAAYGAGDKNEDQWEVWEEEAVGDSALEVALWFDNNYNPSWTADEFLAQLEAQGLA